MVDELASRGIVVERSLERAGKRVDVERIDEQGRVHRDLREGAGPRRDHRHVVCHASSIGRPKPSSNDG